MHHLIERVLSFSNHVSSQEEKSISTTQLIGPAYKAKLRLDKVPETVDMDPLKKRGAAIGSGFHMWAEEALKNDNTLVQEYYMEKRIGDYLITGTLDLVEKLPSSKMVIYDWKTGVKGSFEQESIEKAKIQMSIYRWMLADTILAKTGNYQILDFATILYISTSKNSVEDIDVELMSYQETEEYINAKLFLIESVDRADCHTALGSWACDYCSFQCEFRK